MFLLLSWPGAKGGAQELPLKRTLPGFEAFSCPEIERGPPPTSEEQAQARVLGSNADQALILGDQARARDLLNRATGLDPFSPELAYRFGRILEDLGEADRAIDQFCRALALGAEEMGIEDIGPRLEGLVRSQEPQIPEGARGEFSRGLLQADLGELEGAAQAFGNAFQIAPDWADAVYNRGVILDRQGDVEGAVADLRQYLALRPEGTDAIAVSERIGQLQSQAPLPSPGATFTLGMLIPGMGQFYSGRALGGFTVLTLAGGALAAGFLIEKVETRCVGAVSQGGDCPPNRIISEDTTKPYFTESLIAAGAVAFLGALEAALKVRGSDGEGDGNLVDIDVGGARVTGPSLSSDGPRLSFNLVRVAF